MDDQNQNMEEVTGEPVTDPIADQIGTVWRGLMSAMTAQGATREQIAEVSLKTAGTILDLTSEALWNEGVPAGEEGLRVRFLMASNHCQGSSRQ